MTERRREFLDVLEYAAQLLLLCMTGVKSKSLVIGKLEY